MIPFNAYFQLSQHDTICNQKPNKTVRNSNWESQKVSQNLLAFLDKKFFFLLLNVETIRECFMNGLHSYRLISYWLCDNRF